MPQTGDTVVSDVKEEIMVQQAKPTINVIQNPQTGDTTNLVYPVAGLALASMVLVVNKKRKG